MSSKAKQKKNFIRETARGVFISRGFKNVTMKDIVEACGISRGGLYLYYSDTEELFLDILKMEAEESDDTFSAAIRENASAKEILTLFLKEQKKELRNSGDSLVAASYEYALLKMETDGDSSLRKRFLQSRRIIERLIRSGNESGEFACPDPEKAAANIMFAVEGMKICSRTMKLSGKAVDEEIAYLLNTVLAGKKDESENADVPDTEGDLSESIA